MAVMLAALVLGPVPSASAQSRDDFSYWDANGNGDLTCSEAMGRDEGLRLPAYEDDRDGTGIIYEWLERTRSSDTDNDGIACDSASNPNGYIPNVEEPAPDLVVLGPNVSDNSPVDAGAAFTLSATVTERRGRALLRDAAATTLRYYQRRRMRRSRHRTRRWARTRWASCRHRERAAERVDRSDGAGVGWHVLLRRVRGCGDG